MLHVDAGVNLQIWSAEHASSTVLAHHETAYDLLQDARTGWVTVSSGEATRSIFREDPMAAAGPDERRTTPGVDSLASKFSIDGQLSLPA